jgi:hypothetical protein
VEAAPLGKVMLTMGNCEAHWRIFDLLSAKNLIYRFCAASSSTLDARHGALAYDQQCAAQARFSW